MNTHPKKIGDEVYTQGTQQQLRPKGGQMKDKNKWTNYQGVGDCVQIKKNPSHQLTSPVLVPIIILFPSSCDFHNNW